MFTLNRIEAGYPARDHPPRFVMLCGRCLHRPPSSSTSRRCRAASCDVLLRERGLSCLASWGRMPGRRAGSSTKGGEGVTLKLVHHCLWRTPDGRLVDVTPSDEVRNLILPDTVRNQRRGRTSPIHRPRSRLSKVAKTIAFCMDMDRQQNGDGSAVLLGVGERECAIRQTLQGSALRESRWSGVRSCRNDPCPCGSGKKFKKCCLD